MSDVMDFRNRESSIHTDVDIYHLQFNMKKRLSLDVEK